jgi:hypothetical protein
VQQPPIHFPQGGHLLAFLTCLENGLLPHGQLDPPLWPQRGKGNSFSSIIYVNDSVLNIVAYRDNFYTFILIR